MGGQAEKKIMAEDLLSPLTGESGRMIAGKPKMRTMSFAPAMISFRKETEVEKGFGGEGGSGVGRNAGGWQAANRSGMGGRENGSGMTFVGPKKRGGQRAKLSTWVDSAGDEAVALVKNGGRDGIGGSVGGMAADEFQVFTVLMMLDDRG
jgi:hypothetical protein